MSDIRWVRVGDNSSWHLVADTWISRGGIWLVKTRCGIERMWDQTFLDRLPGGSEKSCENCLKLLARDVDEPAPVKPKKSRKVAS